MPDKTVNQGRPPARTWLLAAIELAGAVLLARLIAWSAQTPTSAPARDHGMPGMAGMSDMPGAAAAPAAHWGWLEYTAIAATAAALVWWLLRRQSVAAVPAALGVAVMAASPAVRILAVRSHLIAMVSLELLLVVVPLLTLAATHRRAERLSARQGPTWTVFAIVAAVLYSALLIAIHLPAVHRRGAELDAVPLWVEALALSIGMAYWSAVLRTAGRVPTQIRRAVLFGAQEVAALIGLLSLFGAWGVMADTSSLGIPMSWDQRFGGVFMIVACGAVTIPVARRI